MSVDILFLVVVIVAVPVAYWGGWLAALDKIRNEESEESDE